jgi:hypothetical protein
MDIKTIANPSGGRFVPDDLRSKTKETTRIGGEGGGEESEGGIDQRASAREYAAQRQRAKTVDLSRISAHK